jgi:transposase
LVDTWSFRTEKEFTMSKAPKRYPQEFKEQVVALARTGRTPRELSDEFGITDNTVRNWVKQAGLDGGERSDGLTTEEKQELARLRRENKQLKVEREILSKAAAWFARETGSIPNGSSNS